MFQATKVSSAAPHAVRGTRGVAVGLLMAVAGTLAVSAWAQPEGGPGFARHAMHAPRGGDFGGPGLFMGRPEHIARGVDRLLQGLNATDAQRTQIVQIAQAAASDLRAQHEAARGLHERGLALFTAPVVDARAVEALRQERLAQHDQASKRMTQAMLDVSAVLTPEQRARLGERVQQREARMKERMQERLQRRGAASAPGA
ncbi:MAG: Spy/CpxP family protein refolding chaperone [Rhizobacter sp.]|nr:Spy/CpxP family protein refolding chaperone [Rhizobacter sp.]